MCTCLAFGGKEGCFDKEKGPTRKCKFVLRAQKAAGSWIS